MRVSIITTTGETVKLEMNDTDTFKDLKEMVVKKVGVSLDLNDIAIKGKKISESLLVNDYFNSYPPPPMERTRTNIFCVVPGCKNTKERNPDKVFFEFPSEEIRCHQWVLYCQRLAAGSYKKRLLFTPESTICSDHFRPDQFVKNTNTLLKRTAVPCMKFFVEESKEQDKYSEGHGLSNLNYISLLTEPGLQCLESDNVRLCRLCASTSDEFYQIFDDLGKEMRIAEKMNLCLPFQVHITDTLPKQVCKACYQELNDLFEMADQCSISQHNLLNLKDKQYTDCSSIRFMYESNAINQEENTFFEISCPLCLDGKFYVCPQETCGNSGLKQEMNISDDAKKDTYLCNDLYLVDEYDHSNSYGGSRLEFDVTGTNNESQIRMEVSAFCEPILIPTKHIKLEPISNKSPKSEAEFMDDPFSQLEPPVSPLSIEDINNRQANCNSEVNNRSIVSESERITIEQLDTNESILEAVLICRICAKEFFSSFGLLNHSYDHSCNDFYQCCSCVNFFQTKTELHSHIEQHLSQDDITRHCSSCYRSFNSTKLLETHVCTKDNNYAINSDNDSQFGNSYVSKSLGLNKFLKDDITYKKHWLYSNSLPKKSHCCDECGKIFKSEASMKYHQRTHQNNSGVKPYSCNRCGKCFIRKSMLINHLASSHANANTETCISCKCCHETFPNTNAAVAHMDNNHKLESVENNTYSFDMQIVKRVLVCEYCERCFVDDSILNKHREQHPSETPYQCKFCSETFISDEQHLSHKVSHNNNKPVEYVVDFNLPKTYLCEYCERRFVNQTKYSEHLSIHFGPEPYKCQHCPPLRFQTLYEALEHREKHGEMTPEVDEYNIYRPYDCHYCNKKFAIEDALIKHIRMHTGEKPFICDQCGKGFSQSSGLYTHQKVHSTERPYSCSVCPRKFKIKGDRDVHVRKHSGDRPYKCEYCGKAFMTQHVYSQHRKIHTGERPYKCDVCGIAFRRSHVLTVHKRIHTGEKPNVCHICGKSYRQKGDMLKHCRVQHGHVNTKKYINPIISS